MKLMKLSVDEVRPNPYQPREKFDEEKLNELSDNIKAHGMIEPIVVTPKDGKYMIVAGERRWRASKKAGIKEVHAIVKDYPSEADIKRDSLVENEIRENLTLTEKWSFANSLARSLKGEYYSKENGVNYRKLCGYLFGYHTEHSVRSLTPEERRRIEGCNMYTTLLKIRRVKEKGTNDLQEAVDDGTINIKTANKIASVDDPKLQNQMVEWAVEKDEEHNIQNELEIHNTKEMWKKAKAVDDANKRKTNESQITLRIVSRFAEWTSDIEQFNRLLKEDKKFMKQLGEENQHQIMDAMKPLHKATTTFMELVGQNLERLAE